MTHRLKPLKSSAFNCPDFSRGTNNWCSCNGHMKYVMEVRRAFSPPYSSDSRAIHSGASLSWKCETRAEMKIVADTALPRYCKPGMNAWSNLKQRGDAVLTNGISANRLILSTKLGVALVWSDAYDQPRRFLNLADLEHPGCFDSFRNR
jgi:hypothetical protein